MLDQALGVADDLFGDDPAAGKTKAEKPPEYPREETLVEEEVGGAAAPQVDNTFDQSPVDLVHFGRVHADDGALFPHDDLSDEPGEQELEEDALARGIQYRAAAQRETLLLHQFMESTQQVLKDYSDSQGPIGELAGAAMDMLASDDASDQPPDHAELDTHKSDVADSGGLVNQDEIKWLDVHTAGKDLHLHRADYQQFCKNCETYYVKKDGGGGGGGLGGLIPPLPGVTDAIKLVQGIVFKAYDIYLAQYLLCRSEFEDDIETAAYDLSIQSLRENWRPVYPIWFPQPPFTPPNTGGPTPPAGPTNFVEKAVDDVKKEVEKVENKVDEVKSDIESFLGIEDDPPTCNGDAKLDEIFDAMLGDPNAAQSPSAAGQFLRGFKEVLGVDSLPEIVEDIIKEITGCNINLLRRVYRAIMHGRGQTPIDEASMIRAGREELADKIMELAGRFIPGLGFLNNPDSSLLKAGSMDVGGESLSNMGSKYIDEGVGAQLGKIVELSSAALAAELEKARTSAGDTAITMELLWGRLPFVLSLQFRNTFFPLVDLVLDLVFGAIAGPATSAMNPVKGFLGDAHSKGKSTYDDVMDVKNKAENVQDKLADGLDLIDAAKDPHAFVDDLIGDDPTGGGPQDAPKPPPFPGNDRATSGKATPVTLEEYDEVQAQQKDMKIMV